MILAAQSAHLKFVVNSEHTQRDRHAALVQEVHRKRHYAE